MPDVKKQIQEQKNTEARDLGIVDFFNQRDKGARGADGLVANATKIINEETKVKQDLYDKSQSVTSTLPGKTYVFKCLPYG